MILHLSNDYSGSKVYMNLFKSLDDLNLNQYVYVPVRSNNLIGKNKILFNSARSFIDYCHILSIYTRLNYKAKINRIVCDIENKEFLNDVNLIHAHTWFSDGGVAYELYLKTGIPYIITIRNTDLNLFFKYMFHLREYGVRILQSAFKIVFISAVYKDRFLNLNGINIKSAVNLPSKCVVIPNGVDAFWIENCFKKSRDLSGIVKLLYVGNFSENKNVLKLIQAVELLNKNEKKFQLTIVGKNGKQERKILKQINGNDSFNYLGEIENKETLLKLFRESDVFTMPSHSETFGLVYIEALSQDIPIIYTLNEGIDGYYNNLKIGEGVTSSSVVSIVRGIEKICDDYKNYVFDNKNILQNHNWNQIAKVYQNIYLSAIS